MALLFVSAQIINAKVLVHMFFECEGTPFGSTLFTNMKERIWFHGVNWSVALIFTVSSCHLIYAYVQGLEMPVFSCVISGLSITALCGTFFLGLHELDLMGQTTNNINNYRSKVIALFMGACAAPLVGYLLIEYRAIWMSRIFELIVLVIMLIFLLTPHTFRGTGRRPPSSDIGPSWSSISKRCPKTNDTYLVIGAGFVGCRLIKSLVLRGEKVRVFDMMKSKLFLQTVGDDPLVTFIKGDVTNLDAVLSACEGVTTVFHSAATIRYFERLKHQLGNSVAINLHGTKNVVDACKQKGVKNLIYVSSSHVCIGKGLCKEMMDESSPYVTPTTTYNHYCISKALAEKLLVESGDDNLFTAAVRPCSAIYGFGDSLQLQAALDDGYVTVPAPAMFIDYVYVDNIVYSLLLTEKAIKSRLPGIVNGDVFCISNNEPITAEDFWLAVKCLRPKVKIFHPPMLFLRSMSYGLEIIERLFPGTVSVLGKFKMMTPACLVLLDLTYTFKTEKAKRVLGYEPAYTVDQGICRALKEYAEGKTMFD
eukprot:NODE_1730_length_1833_cov_56.976608_g1468_i0.p1 GENE.NODE_1730_length_1833_cov_56.976608_g1468_i0~~NODE_1730_length_1833_cov_56.976608_g1468_i0.p1  ORF type:complete len:549 (+),score=72.01 NODE_1730_length_1833_cov_56.976608_g1468_i0:41-1648(+)